MAEHINYPQLPSAIWWGFRDMLIAKPTINVQPKTIALKFDVQETAAKAYIKQLQKIGMLDEEGKPTEVALKWRLDNDYRDAVAEILSSNYPEELTETLNLESLDKLNAKKWFMYDGLGSGAAGNKAATLAVIASPTPGDAAKSESGASAETSQTKNRPKKKAKNDASDSNSQDAPKGNTRSQYPLNVNIQIHISADSSNEQIETIFKSMKKYLN